VNDACIAENKVSRESPCIADGREQYTAREIAHNIFSVSTELKRLRQEDAAAADIQHIMI
jgi:hypothetical protein